MQVSAEIGNRLAIRDGLRTENSIRRHPSAFTPYLTHAIPS